ncbi:MAG: SDR family NAD(P)-dependent oxidoreductase, partial [Mesorhizobium sp.]
FVTGAASGIGRAIATSLQADGTRIVLADRQAEALQALASQLGGEVFALPLDITDASAVDACLEQVPAEFRDIDILVNNAGHDI